MYVNILQEVQKTWLNSGTVQKVYHGLTNRPPQNSKHYLAFMFPSITHMYSLILCTHPLAQDFYEKIIHLDRFFTKTFIGNYQIHSFKSWFEKLRYASYLLYYGNNMKLHICHYHGYWHLFGKSLKFIYTA